jgi:hypothetical protein
MPETYCLPLCCPWFPKSNGRAIRSGSLVIEKRPISTQKSVDFVLCLSLLSSRVRKKEAGQRG